MSWNIAWTNFRHTQDVKGFVVFNVYVVTICCYGVYDYSMFQNYFCVLVFETCIVHLLVINKPATLARTVRSVSTNNHAGLPWQPIRRENQNNEET